MRQVLVGLVFSVAFTGAVFAQSSNQPGNTDQSASAPPYSVPSAAQQQDVQQNLKEVHFAFNEYQLTPDDRSALEQDANWLKSNPEVYVTIAGDADERGSVAYNLYLSQQRAQVTRDALLQMGVPADRIVYATGWGKLYPTCGQSDESCWSENRRAHFEPWQVGSLAAGKSQSKGAESAKASAATLSSESRLENAQASR